MSYIITRVNKSGNTFHYLKVQHSNGGIHTFEQDCTVSMVDNVFTLRGASGEVLVIDKNAIDTVGSTAITTQDAATIHGLIMDLLA